MAIGLIILAIYIFFGYLTPVSDLYTFPISLLLIVFGILRISKKGK
jgi:hypothetical protein